MKYRQYLKLEKGLSDNTIAAYLTDLDKLLSYLMLEKKIGSMLLCPIWNTSLPDSMILRLALARKHVSCRVYVRSIIFWCLRII